MITSLCYIYGLLQRLSYWKFWVRVDSLEVNLVEIQGPAPSESLMIKALRSFRNYLCAL